MRITYSVVRIVLGLRTGSGGPYNWFKIIVSRFFMKKYLYILISVLFVSCGNDNSATTNQISQPRFLHKPVINDTDEFDFYYRDEFGPV